jgi:hypothetical protein
MASFNCPRCGHAQAVDDKHIGKTATCPKCKTQGVVQQLNAEPELSEAEVSDEPGVRQRQGYTLGIYWEGDPSFFTNKESSLKQQWIILDDPRMNVRFRDVFGVVPTWVAERIYSYRVDYSWQSGETPLVAVEFRFLTFDVWGAHVRTLVTSSVKDFAPQSLLKQASQWALFVESEGMEHYASIGYVSRVRTAEGLVLHADQEFVLREAKRFSEKFTEDDLEPKAPIKD